MEEKVRGAGPIKALRIRIKNSSCVIHGTHHTQVIGQIICCRRKKKRMDGIPRLRALVKRQRPWWLLKLTDDVDLWLIGGQESDRREGKGRQDYWMRMCDTQKEWRWRMRFNWLNPSDKDNRNQTERQSKHPVHTEISTQFSPFNVFIRFVLVDLTGRKPDSSETLRVTVWKAPRLIEMTHKLVSKFEEWRIAPVSTTTRMIMIAIIRLTTSLHSYIWWCCI